MKITIDLNVNAPELVEAIRTLGEALTGAGLAPVAPASQTQPAQMAPFPQQPAPAPQFQQPAPASPVAQPTHPAVPAAVPTSAQTYTMEQLAVAATGLMDQGHREKLVQLLAQFGVNALTVLPKEQYGAFATALRAMGAKI